jgi:hypothetical protein
LEAFGLESGVPQGGILSPLLFKVFIADMEDWVEHSGVFTYAENTSTDTSNMDVEEVPKKTHEECKENTRIHGIKRPSGTPTKTVFMLLGSEPERKEHVMVGKIKIYQSAAAKL